MVEMDYKTLKDCIAKSRSNLEYAIDKAYLQAEKDYISLTSMVGMDKYNEAFDDVTREEREARK